MIDTLATWDLEDWVFAAIELVLFLFATLLAIGILYLLYLDIGSALRREGRARGFLHLLEIGLRQGQRIEQAIISLSANRVQALGVYLHLLAAYLESGLPLNAALEKVPRLLPPKIRAMLRVGEEIGDITKVLPACRKTLRDGFSGAQTSANNLVVVLFVCPVGVLLAWFCSLSVLPRLKDIVQDFQVSLPPWTEQIFRLSMCLSIVVLISCLLFYFAGLIHAGGPQFVAWVEKGLWPLSHRFNFSIPWRRKRMQRDFSVMLALLLDSEVPEEKAVLLAARSTANRIFMARAQRTIRDLRAGVKLVEAVRWLDDAGEFRWRLRNTCEPGTGFFTALAGWHESLEAAAFQQEQAVSQTITTGLILLNGLMVGLVAVGTFRLLLALVEEVALW